MDEQIHLVAFLDILGFKQMVDNHFSGKDTNSIDILKNALKEAEQRAIIQNQNFYKQYKVEVSFKQFSDCVSISIPDSADLQSVPSTAIPPWITNTVMIAYDERNIEVHYNIVDYYNDVSIKKDILFIMSTVINSFNDGVF